MEKKIAIILFIVLIFLVFATIVGYVYWGISTLSSTTQIDLTKITTDEENKIIEYNYFGLEKYPESLEFIELKEDSQVRETQYIIRFSIDKEEKELYESEKNKKSIEREGKFFYIEEKDNKMIYEFETDFSSNTRLYKWDFINDLIRKYDNNFTSIRMNEKEKLKKELIDYVVNFDILQKTELNTEELKEYNKIRDQIYSFIERLDRKESSENAIRKEFEELKKNIGIIK